MNEFKQAYQTALQETKVFHIDAADCMNRGKHRERIRRQNYRKAVTVLAAASIFIFVGVGTVSAAGYLQNVIFVNERGFQSSGTRQMIGKEQPLNLARGVAQEEEASKMAELPAEDGLPASEPAAVAAGEQLENASTAVPELAASQESEPSAASVEGEVPDAGQEISMVADQASPETENGEKKMAEDAVPIQEKQSAEEGIMMASEVNFREYTSLEEFQSKETAILPIPTALGNSMTGILVRVSESWVMLECQWENKIFWMERTDYSQTKEHASSKVFPGGVTNERTYQAGNYEYTLADSVKQTEEEPLQIHAAISVGSYELYLDFSGFTEKEAAAVIDSLDLEQYATAQAQPPASQKQPVSQTQPVPQTSQTQQTPHQLK